MAVVPVKPPAFDARTANNAWLAKVRKDDGTPYAVFEGGGFHALNRWTLGIGEYDGKGLFDAVKTNATEQNQIRSQVNGHENRLDNLASRVAALEAQPQVPFPASG